MEKLTLLPHPSSGVTAARRVEATIALSPLGRLRLDFAVSGDVAHLRIADRTAPSRRDGLWRHTCFEAFLKAPRSEGYFEFNFSPSTEWAVYRFRAYREDMTPAEIAAPAITTKKSGRTFALSADIALGALAGARDRLTWRLGLAAVIEESNGEKSYWALAHPPGKPDFHRREGFAHELTREMRS
jgi:hypothetical protein